MNVTFKFSDLLDSLTDVSIVAEDIMSSEDAKNIIFKFTKETVQLIGVSKLMIFKRVLPAGSYYLNIEDSELNDKGYALIQMKSKELREFLNTYKTLRRTKVEDVEFTLLNELKVMCKVSERNLDDNNIYMSSYVFNNIPVKPNIIGNINIEAPDNSEGEVVSVRDILFHTRNLLPIMKNDTGLYGQLIYGNDGVVVAFNASFTTFMKNILPPCFGGIKISYRAVSFMDKIFVNDTQVICKKLDEYMYIYSNNPDRDVESLVFIRYDSALPNYAITKDLFKKDYALALDRKYLKDVLKRLSLVDERIDFRIKCSEDIVEVKNSKYQQEIPIITKKGLDEFEQISFKISPDIINKAIIGSDDEFSPLSFIYYCPQPTGSAIVVFTDRTESGEYMWYSTINVHPNK